MRFELAPFLGIAVFIVLVSVGVVRLNAQSTPTDYSFLANYNEAELKKWVESKKKKELIDSLSYLMAKSEIALKQDDLLKAQILSSLLSKIAQHLNEPSWLGKINYIQSQVLIEQGGEKNNLLAISYLNRAGEYLKTTNDVSSKRLLGIVLLQLADYQTRQINYPAAISNIRAANELAKETDSKQLLGLTLKSLGLFFFFQKKHTYSLAMFERAAELLNIAEDSDILLELYTFSTYLFVNLGRSELGFNSQQKVAELLKHTSSKRKEMLYLYARYYVFNANGDSVEAIKLLRLAQQKADEIGEFTKSLNFQYRIGKTLLWEGDYRKAEIELKLVILGALKPDNTDKELLQLSKIGLAAAFAGQGRSQEAQDLFWLIEKDLGTDPETRYNFYKHYADFLISVKDFQGAKKYIELKAEMAESSDELRQRDIFRLLLDYKTNQISPDRALEGLYKITSNIKDEQMNGKSAGLNINYLDEYILPFRFATLINFEKGDHEAALLAADSYKSRWLTSKMLSDKSFGVTNKSWIVSDEAKALRDKIFQRLLISGIKGEESSDAELQTLLKMHDEKLNQRQDVSALAKKFEKTELSNTELKDLTSNLSKSVILSYAFTNEFLTVLVARQGQPVKAFKIDIKERLLRDKIEKWRGEIVNRELGFKAGSKELYQLLIKPVEDELDGASDLIIVPEGILWKIPFQALLDSQQKYLIQKLPIGYVPSLKVLQTLRNRKGADGMKNVIGFGNSVNSAVAALPGSETEVKNLASVYPSGTYFIRQNATETALKDAISKADILHLAVHGKLDESEPMRSSVVMTMDEQNDGNLEIEEIVNFTRAPELVVLSACSTNDGQVFSGEGLLSLSWAFLAAGSKNVVGTQWEIDDKTTSEEMLLFHKMIANKESINKALQHMVVKQIEKKGAKNHPYYWAGFVSVGGF